MSIDIQSVILSGLESFKTREPLTGTEWADKYFYLSPESSGIEGRWKTLPYQIGPLNWMCDDDIEEFNWMKSARVGYTKCLLISIGYGIEHKKRNIALWQPTDGDAKDFMSDEVETMLRDVPQLGKLLRVPPGVKSKFSTIDKKTFHGAILDIKGGKSGRNYRRMTKDIVMYDELDGFDVDIDKEGSPLELGDTRTQTSSFPKSIRGSTPRVKGVSLIEKALANCKTILYRHLPCPECNTYQKLEFRQLKWENKDPETARYVCSHCDTNIEYHQYPSMDLLGRWQTNDGYYYRDDTDLFYDPIDNVTERPKRIGAHIWSAYSYFTTWEDTVEKWIEATYEAATGSNTKLKTVVNTRLGETWEEQGEKVNPDLFSENRLEAYHFDDCIPDGILLITIGADVQGGKNSRIELEIVGWGIGEESWSIDYVVIDGDPEGDDIWAHLDDQFKRKFKRSDGVVLGIQGGMIDSGYLPTQVFKFTSQREHRRIYATKGKSQYTGPLIGRGNIQGEKIKAIQFPVNTDEAKETIFNRLNKIHEPGPGYCHFPNFYSEEYFKRLTNEEKRDKKKAGNIIGHEWYKLGPNEPLDCRVENMAALKKLNPNFARLKMRHDIEAEHIQLNIPVETRRTGRRIRSGGVE
jgi:terminase, large subunit